MVRSPRRLRRASCACAMNCCHISILMSELLRRLALVSCARFSGCFLMTNIYPMIVLHGCLVMHCLFHLWLNMVKLCTQFTCHLVFGTTILMEKNSKAARLFVMKLTLTRGKTFRCSFAQGQLLQLDRPRIT